MLTTVLIVIGLLIFTFISIVKQWLTLLGALGMLVMGFCIEIAFHLTGLLAIFLFFISSYIISALTRLGHKEKKGETRSLLQVLANGGIPLLMALLDILWPHDIWLFIYLVSVAEANADTWASEIGATRGPAPYHLKLKRPVPRGVSGAMTKMGTLAALLGSCFIAIYSSAIFYHQSILSLMLFFVTISCLGWLGQFFDTLFGAYLQGRYRCTVCHALTDATRHCGNKTSVDGGLPYISNNLVNALSSLLITIFTGTLYICISKWII